MASASDWSRPKGPCTLGPGRTCMRATTLRSNQMANSTLVSRNTTMATALISQIHQRVVAEVGGRPGATASAAGSVMRGPPRSVAWTAAARRTTAPASACRASRTRDAGGVRRQPHHVVRHVGDHGGQRQRAARRCDTVRLPPSCTPTAAAVAAEMRATGRLAVPARNCSPSCSAPASSSWCQVASTADPAPTAGGSAAGDVGGADAGAVPAAELVELGVHRGQRLQPQLDPERVGERVEHAVVGHRVRGQGLRERARAALPGDERAGLLGGRRDRQHDVRAVGHLRVPDLERDDERDPVERLAGDGRVGQVRELEAADDEAAELARRARRRGSRAVARPGCGRQVLDAPGRREVDACRGVGDRTTARQQRRQQAGLDARRARPTRRGTQASRAPVRCASRTAAREAAGHRRRAARRRGSTAPAAREQLGQLVAPGDGVGADARRGPPPRCRAPRAAACPTAARARGSRARRPDSTRSLLRQHGLAQPQERDARLLLGLEADEQHGGRRSRSRERDLERAAGDVVAEEVSSSAECGRARPSTSLVPSATRANFAVRVGVLEREATAGQHADAARLARVVGAARPAGRRRRRRAPRPELAGSSSPSPRRGPAGS